jgi:hypothetical protein
VSRDPDNCDVCRSVSRRYVNAQLARGRTSANIARRVLMGRKQIVRHRAICLEGDPLRAVAEEMGFKLTEEKAVLEKT